MQCSKCGSETAAGAAFCPVCDHPVNLARTAGAPAQINFRLMSGRFFSKAAFWKILAAAVALAAAVSGVFFLYRYYPEWQRYFPPCPFHALLHLHCPGCGSTRAAYCLLHGDLTGVLRYNPICLPTLFFVVLPVFQDKWSVKPVIVRWYIVILVLFWICRNLPWYPFTFLAPPPGF